MSVLATFIGLTYLFLNNAERFFEDKTNLRMAIYGSIVLILIAQKLYVVGYRIKSPWYNPEFSPPDYYQRGSLASD